MFYEISGERLLRLTSGEAVTPKAPLCKGGCLPVRADWGIVQQSLSIYIPFGEIETSQRDNPSVTASPCHLPLHRGGFLRADGIRPYSIGSTLDKGCRGVVLRAANLK